MFNTERRVIRLLSISHSYMFNRERRVIRLLLISHCSDCFLSPFCTEPRGTYASVQANHSSSTDSELVAQPAVYEPIASQSQTISTDVAHDLEPPPSPYMAVSSQTQLDDYQPLSILAGSRWRQATAKGGEKKPEESEYQPIIGKPQENAYAKPTGIEQSQNHGKEARRLQGVAYEVVQMKTFG